MKCLFQCEHIQSTIGSESHRGESGKYGESLMFKYARRNKKMTKRKLRGIVVPLNINNNRKRMNLPKIKNTFLYMQKHNETKYELLSCLF